MRHAILSSSASRRWFGLAVGLSITVFALYMLAHTVDWRSALQYIQQVKAGWLLLGLTALLINNFAKASRWRQLFPVSQTLPPRWDAFGSLMAGQLLNFTLPFRSGDISRAYFMGRGRGTSSAAAAGTIGAEKLLDMVIMGGLFTLALPFFILPTWLEANKDSIWIISFAALGVWIVMVIGLPRSQNLLDKLAHRWPVIAWPAHAITRLLDGFSALRHRQRLIPVLFWTAIVWAGSICATYALLAALALPDSLPLAVLANVIVQGGLSVPVAPAGIGVFEWLAILALSIAGIPSDQGLAYGLVMHAAVLFFPVIIGVPWLLARFRSG